MILIIVVFSYNVEELQAAVYHSNKEHECQQMEKCPYINHTLIKKVDWI